MVKNQDPGSGINMIISQIRSAVAERAEINLQLSFDIYSDVSLFGGNFFKYALYSTVFLLLPSDAIVLEDAGIEPRTVATGNDVLFNMFFMKVRPVLPGRVPSPEEELLRRDEECGCIPRGKTHMSSFKNNLFRWPFKSFRFLLRTRSQN
jgi:hypothetical protein